VRYSFFLFLLVTGATVRAGVMIDTAGMRREIEAVYDREPQGSFAVAFKDLSTGQQFFVNAHVSYHAASTMKTPVLVETFRLVAARKLALTDSLLIHTDFLSIADSSRFELDSASDSEKELYRLAGKRMALRELLFRMITESSNLATNLVIEAVGAKNVQSAMRQLGAMDIQVLRGVEDEKAFEKGMNNTTTAYDLMLIFDRIATGKAVDPSSCQAMIDILKAQHFKEVIAGKLPEGVQVASKSGWISGVCHDSGIVFLPDGRKYVLVLLSNGIADHEEAEEAGATVSRIIYEHMMGRESGMGSGETGRGMRNAGQGGTGMGKDTGKLAAAFPVVDHLFKTYAAKNHFPGLVYGIVAGGKLVYAGNMGYGDLEKKIPAGPQSDFRIASMTKSFISVAILQLRDAGKIRLDDPAALYIPGLKGQQGTASDAPVITIRNLLTHSAGFPEDNPWGDRQLAATDAELLDMVRKGISFSNSPGIAYEYSNTGFALLGYIVQQVSGEPYEQYVTKHILQPLGMDHTYWEYADVPAERLAHGYRWLNEHWVEQPLLHDGAYGAMGGMITTLEDFAKYVAFQLDAWPSRSGDEEGPLKRSSRREMQQPWMFNNLNSQFTYYPGARICPLVSSYCYGLRWSKDCKGRTLVGHTGGLPGFGSNWNTLTDYGIGVISFSNLTYANCGAINLQVLDTLVTLVGLRPRPVPVSPVLEQRKKELIALLPDWKDAQNSGIFAVNFWLDYFPDSLRKEATAIFARAGKIVGVGEMQADNGLRGSFVLKGTRGDIEIRFTLTPENPAKIQEYHIRLLQ
jgi:CubicO group peptidase (beta-lactamase class C family)